MPNLTGSAFGGAMSESLNSRRTVVRGRGRAAVLSKAAPAIDPPWPDPQRDFVDDLSILPERYTMRVCGQCLDPIIPDGSSVLIDKTAPYESGDLVVVYRGTEKAPSGTFQAQLKRLVLAPPPWVTFPWRASALSGIEEVVILEMINPGRQFAVRCADIAGIHKCFGIVPADTPRVRISLAELRKAAARAPAQNARGAADA